MHFTENPEPIGRESGTFKLVSFFVGVGVLYAGFLLFFASAPNALKYTMSSKVVEDPAGMIPELQMHSKKYSPQSPISNKFVKDQDYRVQGEIHKVVDLETYTGKQDDVTFLLCKNGKITLGQSSSHIDYYWVKVNKSKFKPGSLQPGRVLEVIHSKSVNSKLAKRNLRFFFAPKSAYLARHIR